MNDKLVFFISAYLLFALFLTIHIFTANILAEAMAVFFGISLVVNVCHHYRDKLKEVTWNLITHFTRIVKYFSIR